MAFRHELQLKNQKKKRFSGAGRVRELWQVRLQPFQLGGGGQEDEECEEESGLQCTSPLK